ncbi:helix-turn-helix domain-containing protein [Streptomyces hainanensis]|uniref:XRE family transcriptional regulator n=1 Tax=Streptomyces hainanensis TaxID=402648 RepID=A0A4R4SY55_9ACTN|nr:helix-turn-helix transcriptional regulator [Streptomyces hainanensis]TDC69278.1 XRE family transcriptional regulator [Streptomyces hainanensis]
MARAKLPPTVRQRRLGSELRRLRERADLSATRAGQLFGATQARISYIEAGGYAVSAERVRALARLYSCADERLVEALAGMTGGRTRGWWDEYRHVLPTAALDLAELEHHARFVRVVSVVHVPGLLQTPEHARAVVSDVVPALAPAEVERWVSHRIKRQGILYGDASTPLTAVVHEAALRMAFGGRTTARAQLAVLLSRSEAPNITLRIIPFAVGTFPSAGHSVDQIGGSIPELDTIQLDTDHGSWFLDAPSQLVRYRMMLDRMEASSLSPDASRDLIRSIEKSL